MTVMSSLSLACVLFKKHYECTMMVEQAYVCNRTNHYAKHNLRQKEMYALLRNMCASTDEE